MKMTWMLAVACALAGAPASAAEPDSACMHDSQAQGLRARIDNLRDQMDRIEWTTDRAERQQLMELHSKLLREGLREMRMRKVRTECQLEVMGTMMESMARHELVMHEDHHRGR